jgi:Cas10/Cmr2, second palm domain
MPRYLLVVDTPGIKQFVFGTDTLAEVRGASALLKRLNVEETETVLRSQLPAIETVYANGGTGQFHVEAPGPQPVEEALKALARVYREETGGEVRIVGGVAELAGDYRRAVRQAYAQLHAVRDTQAGVPAAATFPFLMECRSASHLPVADDAPFAWGGERHLLSDACRRKRTESVGARRHGLWSEWMEHLRAGNHWPENADRLRPVGPEDIGDASGRRRGYVGLVYADGNAMGRLVQELESVEACREFSAVVDGSIHQACFESLDEVCRAEVAAVRQAGRLRLPADILLLGGDDLLVLLPADRTLAFALSVCEKFEQLSRDRIARLPSGDARDFFAARLPQGQGMTVSCGVAFAPAKYPFYLLFNLAEELLKNAKKGGSADKDAGDYRAPSYIDFHLVAGASSQDLGPVREQDYQTGKESKYHRTLRPYRREQLDKLRQAVERLQAARFPRSKLQALFEAALDLREPVPEKPDACALSETGPEHAKALERRERKAEQGARELFGRLKKHERQALWLALLDLGILERFPWYNIGEHHATALADLVEACDLFPPNEEDHR